MADNEAKARQKMAEGDKKLRGGGGFFSKMLGGGGGSGDAADLYIQNEDNDITDDVEMEEGTSADSEVCDDIECGYLGCNYVANNLLEFEQHYQLHSFQCIECGSSFNTANMLDIHQDEEHNPFFAIQVEKNPESSHFRCYHPNCDMRFSNCRTRDLHAKISHFIQNDTKKRRNEEESRGIEYVLSTSMGKMKMEPNGEENWKIGNERKIVKARRIIGKKE